MFYLQRNGILAVKATDPLTDKSAQVDVRSGTLSKMEIKRLREEIEK